MSGEEVVSLVVFYAAGVLGFVWAVAFFVFMFTTRHADRRYRLVRLSELNND